LGFGLTVLSFFLIFRILGPLEGLSEYLVQKTQAGQSCPFGPRTIPGGTPSSPPSALLSLEADEAVETGFEDKSTGWLLLFKGEDGGLLSSLFTRLPLLEDEELGDLCLSTDCCCEAAAAAEAAAKLRKAELCKNVLAEGPKDGFNMLSMEKGSAR